MKTFLLTLTGLLIAGCAIAQEDVTSKYMKNVSFELDDIAKLQAVNNPSDGLRGYTCASPAGWVVGGDQVTALIVTKECFTDNNFGIVTTIPEGKQAFYLRQGWSTGTTSLTQTIANLPVGKYKLSVEQRTGYANSATSTINIKGGTASASVSFDAGSTDKNYFPTKSWKTSEVSFEVKSEGSVVVGADVVWQSGGSCVMFDNFKLYKLDDSYEDPKDPTEADVKSPTEGVITSEFVAEADMKSDLLQMLANFSKYMVNDFHTSTGKNSKNENLGYFYNEAGGTTINNDERGIRPTADLSMICAFLVKYGKPAGVKLPSGITWDKLEDMAMRSLTFCYSTHKANRFAKCSNNGNWGSTSASDFTWESSLWAMSVAYSAYFQWNKLSADQKTYIYNMLKAECNYELYRGIPTGYNGDTKAEENGWEVDILAATLGLFPNDELAPKWFERMREFAINSYSHPSDADNTTVIDPEYNNKTVADLYKGQNLYDDYSLQNHNLFHTSYQNVVMQELGEAALALKMFQHGIYGEEKWKSNALMHHNQEVQDSILNWLALPDGELAMPNGNDWSLFLYDQITSYTTQACFQRDANALMLENMAYKYIKARQQTTTDGSWLLRADVGARRMGVEAHRVMMTFLMHDVLSTADLTPTAWDDFNKKFAEAKILPCQNVVRAASDDRFTTFSWSTGLKSYTGYLAANTPDKNKIVVPFRANNTGNFLGWYEVSGKGNNAEPVTSGIYQLKGNSYVMNGELNTNDKSLNNRFAIYSTPGNAVIYLDYVTAKAACTINAEKGGLLAISVDDMTKLSRTLYYNNGASDEPSEYRQLDGTVFTQIESSWVNIDNEVGVVGFNNGKKIAFGDRANNNSVMTAKLYPMYSNKSRSVKANDVVDARGLIYYSNINAEDTKTLAFKSESLKEKCEEGWNGILACDPNGMAYVFVSNFYGKGNTLTLTDVQVEQYAPVFVEQTIVSDSKSTVTVSAVQNNSVAEPLSVFIKGTNVLAQQGESGTAYMTAEANTNVDVRIIDGDGKEHVKDGISIKKGETVYVYLKNGEVCVESASIPTAEEGEDLTKKIVNPTFDGNSAYGWSGTVPAFQSYTDAEFFNTNFDFYQVIYDLEPGKYEVGVQGFYREGTYASAAQKHNAESEQLNAEFYANDEKVNLVSIFSDASKNYKIGVSTVAGYVPDNMEQAASYFRRGLYLNKVEAIVGEDGTLKIGLRKTRSVASDWTIFDNFSLKYLGTNSENDPADDPVDNPTDDPTDNPEENPENPEEPNSLRGMSVSNDAQVFNLQGNKLDTKVADLPAGIYVIDGKKVRIVK